MPSAKVLEEKKQIVSELTEKIKNATSGVIVNYQGIKVEQDTKMRKELREAGVDYFVIKNTLLRFAVKECGYDEFIPNLEHMTALALSSDPVAPAKIISGYAEKIESFTIKAGFVEGKVIDDKGVDQLAKLPSKEVLIAKMLGSMNAPITGLVTVLNGNIRGLACVLQAIADKKA